MVDDRDESSEEWDERLQAEGVELLGELAGCDPDDVSKTLAEALGECSTEQASRVADYIAGIAGALGAFADALADGEVSPDDTRDLQAIGGEAVSDLTELVHVLCPPSEADNGQEVEIDV